MNRPFRPITEIHPVRQKHHGGETCLQACVASLVGAKHDDLPDFYGRWETDGHEAAWNELVDWLHERGYDMFCIPADETDRWPLPDGHYIAEWAWSHANTNHAVIERNGKLAHDPSPGRKPDYIVRYYVLEPIVGWGVRDCG